MLTWVESSEQNQKWYLEKAGKEIILLPNGIKILGNTWKIEDEKMSGNPEKGIWNKNGNTYFSFDAQKELFGDNVPKKDDWVNLNGFLPGNDANRVEFLSKVLGLNFGGYYDVYYRELNEEGVTANYWISNSIDSEGYAYTIVFNISEVDTYKKSNPDIGFSVRCFNN